MAGKSNIEWTGFSWNPIVGCSVLTPGCKRCYAMRLAKRLGAMGNPLYQGLTQDSSAGAVWTGEMRRAPRHTLVEPLRRKKPTTWFVNSMSDPFHENVPDVWIDQVFAVMALTSWHTYQVLTKRAERMWQYLSAGREALHTRWLLAAREILGTGARGEINGIWPLPNVWLGVSTERQQEADDRIPWLLNTPAAIRFISAEPLLGPINLDRIHESGELPGGACWDSWESSLNGKRFDFWADDDEDPMKPGHPKLDWVIVGGESGHGYRPMAEEWAQAIIDQCRGAGVAVFMKQMAGKKPIPDHLASREFPQRVTT